MFDTVRLAKSDLELDTGKLRAKGWVKFTRENIDAEGVAQVAECWRPDLKGKHPHYLQYTPKRGELKLETSLPKVLKDSNVQLLSPGDVEKCFDVMSERVSSWVGGDIPHVGGWDIRGRVDSVFAWQVGSHVGDYLHALKSVGLSRHVSQSVDREATLYWRNAQRVIRVYDKEKESHQSAARGVLRFEVQANHAKAEFDRLAGIKSTMARDVLTWQNARAVLSNYLDGVGADLVIASDEKCFAMLADKFGATRAVRLFGYVQAMRRFSRDELIQRGVRRETIWRAVRDINLAGASVGVARSGVLRPLRLPETYTGDAARPG